MRPIRGGLLAGLILILVGVSLLVGNLTTVGGWIVALGVGVAFVAAYFWSGRYGFLIVGCLVTALGAFAGLEESGVLGDREGAWFFGVLGLSFIAIYLIAARWHSWWPLVPGGLLVAFGTAVGLADLITLPALEDWQNVARWWPLFLILVGAWIFLGRYLSPTVRWVSGAAIGVVTVAFVLFTAAVGVASSVDATSGGWFFTTRGNLEFKDTVERTATVPVGGSVTIRNSSGNTTVRHGEGREVKVVATRRVHLWSEKDAQRALDRLEVAVQETGNGNGVEISWRRSSGGVWFAIGPVESVDFEVTVPGSASVEVRASSGGVQVQDVDGDLAIHASSGNVDVRGVRGSVKIDAQSGNTRVQDAGGRVEATCSSGNLSVVGLRDTFRLESHSGNVDVSGDVRAGGSIKASSGSVRLSPSLESAFRLDAETSSGRVNAEARYKVERRNKDSLVAIVGDGGATVTVRVSSGNVDLR